MSTKVLGLGELAATSELDTGLAAIGLGSCVALIIMSRDARMVSMAHVVLPDPPVERDDKPRGYYPAWAVDELLSLFSRRGIVTHDLQVKLVGGNRVGGGNDTYRIGKRNVMRLRRELWRVGLVPTAEFVGRQVPVTVDIRPGLRGAVVSSPGQKEIML